MIDPATGQFGILQYNNKHTTKIENLAEKSYLMVMYISNAKIIIYDLGNELLGHELKHNRIKN